ncbi:MAG: undecaprenyl-diphosphate phosphatase [Alphaproteobacteria bacterium]|jgi:undecaprenyl-diphosphatase|nr:undecaprenyl-diphosphate phosphatase [Alphaproteobacteria bacterium]
MQEFLWKVVSAVILALVEGLTEFLPVSSTGHMILVKDLLGLETPPDRVFEIFIQFGAILAICVIYFEQLWRVTKALPHNENAQRFFLGLFIAFLPAAALGVLFADNIKYYLFNPFVVATMLVVGGVAILFIERMVKIPQYYAVEDFPLILYLKIGLCQCLALVPGVSRSGATIMGSLLMRVERSAAAEFSFFLAIPTMLGASTYSLYKSWHVLHYEDLFVLVLGFFIAFFAAYWVARRFVSFVSTHGFGIFAWYRIVIGSFMLGYYSLRTAAAA